MNIYVYTYTPSHHQYIVHMINNKQKKKWGENQTRNEPKENEKKKKESNFSI